MWIFSTALLTRALRMFASAAASLGHIPVLLLSCFFPEQDACFDEEMGPALLIANFISNQRAAFYRAMF